MKNIKIVRPLNNESISDAVEAVTDFLKGGSCDSKDVVRVTLSVEESLLTFKNELPEGDSFTVRCAKFLKTITVTLTVSGKNVTEQFYEDDSFIFPMNSILSAASITPEYTYENGMNKVRLEIKEKKRLSLVASSFLAIAVGALLGVLALFLPSSAGAAISEQFVSPVFSTFISVVTSVAGIMVFLTVTQSIYLIGDKNSFHKIGSCFFRNTLGKMMLIMRII